MGGSRPFHSDEDSLAASAGHAGSGVYQDPQVVGRAVQNLSLGCLLPW